MKKLIKVCGMTQGWNIREVEALGVDLMGFIFYSASPRFVLNMPDYLPTRCRRAGVFVDAPEDSILGRTEDYSLDFVQLHGHESPGFCRRLKDKGLKVIKVFHVSDLQDLMEVSFFEGFCEYFLFDTACPGAGGSGRSFDWDVLQSYSGKTPFFLSGGIGPESVEAISYFRHPRLAGYDLNSRFETSPGTKDAKLISEFLKHIDNEQDK